jgi:hypothetical protein
MDYNILNYGVIGDGNTLNTLAIQRALDAAAQAGGGAVVVPPGNYLIGTIFLRTNTTLHLEAGAALIGSPRLSDYAALTWGKAGDRTPWHLVVAKDVHHVAIDGMGTIDGNGPAFWEPTVPLPGGDGSPLTVIPAREPDAVRGPISWIKHIPNQRPSPMIEITNCQDVRIENIHITNSAGWCLHLHDCDRCQVRGVRLTTNLMGPNNDGFDITGCRDVIISDCNISCCDDAICLKNTPDSRGTERITVTNCIIRTRCAAFKTGESFVGPMRQVTFSNSVIYECSRAIALYATEGAVLEDFAISNIVCDTRSPLMVNRPIQLQLEGGSGRPMYMNLPNQQVEGGTVMKEPQPLGAIRNISISNFIARTDGRILMTAESGAMLENITLRDVHLIYPTVDDPDPIGAQMTSGQFCRTNPAARLARGAVVAENIRNLVVDGLQITWPEEGAPATGTPCPEEWYFPLKGANGMYRLFERAEFNHDRTPDFPVLWGRNLQGGYIHAPLAKPSRAGVPDNDLENSTIVRL